MPQSDETIKTGYIVNRAGTVHQVEMTVVELRTLLANPYFRVATKDEIAAYKRVKGHQVTGMPIAQPIEVKRVRSESAE
jgi:hypothetical protein